MRQFLKSSFWLFLFSQILGVYIFALLVCLFFMKGADIIYLLTVAEYVALLMFPVFGASLLLSGASLKKIEYLGKMGVNIFTHPISFFKEKPLREEEFPQEQEEEPLEEQTENVDEPRRFIVLAWFWLKNSPSTGHGLGGWEDILRNQKEEREILCEQDDCEQDTGKFLSFTTEAEAREAIKEHGKYYNVFQIVNLHKGTVIEIDQKGNEQRISI